MEIQERIITEAGKLFARYGIRSITMDALAEDMGISKRTIYENFKDKDTLLSEVITYYKSNQLEETQKIIANSENIIDAMFKMLERMIDTMKTINPIFFQDIKKYHPDIFSQIQEKGDLKDHSITLQILNEGIRQGIFLKEINVEIVNNALHELFNLFSPSSHLTHLGFHRGELFNNIILPYLKGISTGKGINLIEKEGEIIYE